MLSLNLSKWSPVWRSSSGILLRNLSSGARDSAQAEPKPVEADQRTSVQPSVEKKTKLEPFVKNLFLGRFDKSVLAFPKPLTKDSHETLHDMITPIEKFFLEELDSASIDRNAKIPPEVLDQVKEIGLYGMQVPVEYGGLGLGATEFSRISEITAMDGSIGVTIAAHQSIGYKGLLLAGSEYLKEKYLPRLASGELLAAFCLTEANAGSDAASVQTRATLAEDGKTWLLNGSKMWISNGGTADVMTVFARTEVDGQDKVTAFFVERAFGGVTSGAPEDKMGIRGSNTAEVHFENTPVPSENIVGELGKGFKLAVTILNSGRFTMGSATAGVLKRGLGYALEHAMSRKQFGHTINEFGLIKEKFAEAAVNIYAMESMTYLAAGLMDSYDEHDTAVEAAIIKVFSSNQGWILGSELLQVMGGLGYMKSYPFERFLRDGRITLIFEGTNEILRIFIALMGLQHAGVELKSMVKKLRNPLMHPGFVFKTAFRQFRDSIDRPKLVHDLPGYVHPTLKESATSLEYCTERFRYAVQTILSRYGLDVVKPEHQMDVVRLGDIAIDLFAMTSVLSRASRSYCDGIHNAEHEVLLAQSFCKQAEKRIRTLCTGVKNLAETNDLEFAAIADMMYSKGGYAAEHPLTVNGW